MREWIRGRWSSFMAWLRRFFRAILGVFIELPPDNTIAPPLNDAGWEWLQGTGAVEVVRDEPLPLPSGSGYPFTPPTFAGVATLKVVAQAPSQFEDSGKVPPPIPIRFGEKPLPEINLGQDVELDSLGSLKKLGEGGEAVVYRVEVGRGRGKPKTVQAVKVFHRPEDPVYKGKPAEQEDARVRFQEYPEKLREFPGLPKRVVAPLGIVTKGGKLAGYLMPLVEFSCTFEKLLNVEERASLNVSLQEIVALLLDIHDTLLACHEAGFVIGDLKPENLLCSSGAAFLVDAESGQWNGWKCRKFTDEYADPQICDSKSEFPERVKPPTADSDWFIFASMVCRALTGIGPWDGLYLKSGRKLDQWARAKAGVSIFTDGVKLPPFARDPKNLTKSLVNVLRQYFEEGRRGEFPRQILEELLWTECSCGVEFCGAACGACGKVRTDRTPGRVVGSVRPLFADPDSSQDGELLAAGFVGSQLEAVIRRGDVLYRENGSVVGRLAQSVDRCLVLGPRVGLVVGANCIILEPGQQPKKVEGLDVGLLGDRLVAGAGDTLAASVGGEIVVSRLDRGGDLRSVLQAPNHGVLWMGDSGFGAYLSDTPGSPMSLHIFEVDGRKATVQCDFPEINGSVLEARAYFGDRTVWIALKTEQLERELRYLIAVDRKGDLLAWTKVSEREVPEWFITLTAKFAVDDGERRFLLAGSQAGLVRLEVLGEKIIVEGVLTGFSVDPHSEIYLHAGGLYEVSGTGIRSLVLEPRMSDLQTPDPLQSGLTGSTSVAATEEERNLHLYS